LQRSPKDYRETFDVLKSPPLPDVDVLERLAGGQFASVSGFRRVGVAPVVADPQPQMPDTTREQQEEHVQALCAAEPDFLLCGFEPPFVRHAPPLLCPELSEAMWLNLEPEATPLWDYSMCADTSKMSEVRELVARAFRVPLLPNEQQQVLAELEADAKLVYHCGLTPKRLPDLVENNPLVTPTNPTQPVLGAVLGEDGSVASCRVSVFLTFFSVSFRWRLKFCSNSCRPVRSRSTFRFW